MYEPTSYHKRPPGGSLASEPSQTWLGLMTLTAPGRPKPPLGRVGLPARPIARTPEMVGPQAAQAERLRNRTVRCGKRPALRAHATQARRRGGVVGVGQRGRAAAYSRRNGPTGHRSGRIGSARRRPCGGLARRPDRLRGAASELTSHMRQVRYRCEAGVACGRSHSS